MESKLSIAPRLTTNQRRFSPWPGLARATRLEPSLRCPLSDRPHWLSQGECDIQSTQPCHPPNEMLKVHGADKDPDPAVNYHQREAAGLCGHRGWTRQRSDRVPRLWGALRREGGSRHSCGVILQDALQSTSRYADLYRICCYLSRRVLRE